MKPTTRGPTRLIPLALVSLLGLMVLLLMPAGSQAQAAAPDGGAASSPAPASAPLLVIRGLRVVSGAPGIGAAANPAAVSADRPGAGLQGRAVAASAPVGLAAAPLPTSTHDALKTLTSAGGDLEVTVSADSYAQATRYRVAQQPAAELQLFLNGFNMAPAAVLFAQQTATDGQSVHLRFHLDSNAEAQEFWRSIYREHGLAQRSDLHVELGWQATGPNSRIERAASLAVAVAPDLRRWAAVGLLLLVLVMMIFLIRCSNTFRDTVPSWLATASHWEDAFRKAENDGARETILLTINPSYEKEASLRAAEALMRGGEVGPAGVSAAASATATAKAEAHPAAALLPPMLAGPDVACGLLLRRVREGKPLPRPPYSLCRLQVGLWFSFVVATGLLLWIAYGYLPAISGSVLALMGISVGSAVAAVSVEPAAAEAGSTASQGLLVDVVTGFDQSQQLHRYQSVCVNVLLLLVGMHAVWNDLDFPVFDSTWLGFLGVSGVALAAGKQFVEKPAAETRGANAAVAAAKQSD